MSGCYRSKLNILLSCKKIGKNIISQSPATILIIFLQENFQKKQRLKGIKKSPVATMNKNNGGVRGVKVVEDFLIFLRRVVGCRIVLRAYRASTESDLSSLYEFTAEKFFVNLAMHMSTSPIMKFFMYIFQVFIRDVRVNLSRTNVRVP